MTAIPTDAPPEPWVPTDRSRRRARLTAAVRHPHALLRATLGRRRGLREAPAPPVGADEVLERLVGLPVSVWTYGYDHRTVRHLGPMAQDFARAFGLGSDERRIDLVDASGVAMAACQALYRRVVALEQRVAELEAAHADGGDDGAPSAGRT